MSPEALPDEPTPDEKAWYERDRIMRGRTGAFLNKLQKYELGRAIINGQFDRINLMGYILPLDLEDNSHLIIFEDGYMAVTQADMEVKECGDIYRERMRRNIADYLTSERRPVNIIHFINLHPLGPGARRVGNVLFTNEIGKSVDKFKDAASEALTVIRQNLRKRRKILIQTTEAVRDTIDSLTLTGVGFFE